MDTKCLCCIIPQNESIQHVFSDSEMAKNIWNYFGNPLGINHQGGNIRILFNAWWNMNTANSVHNMVHQITPMCIAWGIWKNWTSCRFGDQTKYLISRMEMQILWNIKAAICVAFPTCDLTGKMDSNLHKN